MSNIIRHRLCGFALGLTLAVVWTVCGAGSTRAQEANEGVPGDWLSRYMGARTAGLGGAFVSRNNGKVSPVAPAFVPPRVSLTALYQLW